MDTGNDMKRSRRQLEMLGLGGFGVPDSSSVTVISNPNHDHS